MGLYQDTMYVVARSYKDYVRWTKNNQLSYRTQTRYISKCSQLNGLVGYTLMFLPDWMDNKSLDSIKEFNNLVRMCCIANRIKVIGKEENMALAPELACVSLMNENVGKKAELSIWKGRRTIATMRGEIMRVITPLSGHDWVIVSHHGAASLSKNDTFTMQWDEEKNHWKIGLEV